MSTMGKKNVATMTGHDCRTRLTELDSLDSILNNNKRDPTSKRKDRADMKLRAF